MRDIKLYIRAADTKQKQDKRNGCGMRTFNTY